MRTEPIDARTVGANVAENGGVAFRVWAPRASAVAVDVVGRGRHAMTAEPRGYWYAHVDAAQAGDDYMYSLDAHRLLPDPASRRQPRGVNGPSRVVDPASFPWSDARYSPAPLGSAVLYELHVGTFTAEGTFDAAIAELDALADVGVTTLELMPVASFPGERNWGYDGVGIFAPHEAYGGPDGLRRLVDAAHARGLGVCIDVVHNHFGPEGHYGEAFGPYATDRYVTPWGRAMNFDGPESDAVRAFVTQNARSWISEFHVDGLRLDAVQTIFDVTARHVLADIAEAVHDAGRRRGRAAWVIAESNQNDPRLTRAEGRGGLGMDAQWSDDLHHAVHAAHLGARGGTFVDFGRAGQIAKAVRSGFVLDGGYSAYRRRAHGASGAEIPPARLVTFLENHDQIANARGGRRVTTLTSADMERALLALLLLGPNLPMLFMGQEYGETAPFHYFTNHADAALTRAVREGRARDHGSDGISLPDPDDAETFFACKLAGRVDGEGTRARRALVRELLALRRRHGGAAAEPVACDEGDGGAWLSLTRRAHGKVLFVAVSFARESATVPLPADHASALRRTLSTSETRFGGDGSDDDAASEARDTLVIGPRRAWVYESARDELSAR